MPTPKPQEELVGEGAPMRWELEGDEVGIRGGKDGALEIKVRLADTNRR
jgi:hypothetical protein